MKTANNEILEIIEEQIKLAEIKNENLKNKLNELKQGKSISGSELVSPPSIPEKAIYRVMNSRYDRNISTNLKYDQFFSTIKTNLPEGTLSFGFQTGDQIIWIRNDRDINLMFRYHFFRKDQFIKIEPISTQFIQHFSSIDLNKEINNEEKATFLYSIGKSDFLLFYSTPSNISYEEAQKYFSILNPKHTSLKFIDSNGDSFFITNEDEWKYSIIESISTSNFGQYCRYISE